MDESTQSALLCVALHVPVTLEAIDRIVPTDGSFWNAGRFRAAYLEQYMLQYVAFLSSSIENLTQGSLGIYHRLLDEEADVERWLRVSEDEHRGVVGIKPTPVYFAYHAASEKNAAKREIAKLKAAAVAKESHIYQILQDCEEFNPSDHLACSEWFRDSASQFVQAFCRSASASDVVEAMEWNEISLALSKRLATGIVKALAPELSGYFESTIRAFAVLSLAAHRSKLRCFVGVMDSDTGDANVALAFISEKRVLFIDAVGYDTGTSSIEETLRAFSSQ